ncbi:MAG: PEGA domain-containing protein [Deltaproteobacteria bacterium]|nr:PEGA domain-containing protein [Deltaproteobacteria bacterium]
MKALVATLVVVWCSTAAAQSARPNGGYIGRDIPVLEIDDCRPTTSKDPEKEAGEHFERGQLLYDQGDYPGAVKELVSAYCLAPHYLPLMSIGLSYERELEYEKAIAYFERFVMAVPKDAKPSENCAADPQQQKATIAARIRVLESLPAKVRVNTEPPDAHIVIANEARKEAESRSGKEIEIAGGRYTMTIDRDGYQTVTQEIVTEVGKPYTFFEKLEPRRGRVRIHIVPEDARLFIDKRQVGTGVYEADLPGGKYTLSAEQPDFITDTREVEVIADRDTTINVELNPKPQIGRRQLIAYGTIAGGIAGGTLTGAQNSGFYDFIGVVGGSLAGGAAAWFGAGDVPLGTSSLTITSSVFGGIAGFAAASIFTEDGNVLAPALGGGLVLGALGGYYGGEYFHVRPGDAAVVNSGALWGSVTGGLFSISFDSKTQHRSIDAGIVLSGLGIGMVGGALLAHNYTVSRGHAALIDTSGVLGIILGLAANSVVERASGDTSTARSDERTANFALGGLAVGLIAGGVLTRHMDEPALSVTPVMNKAATANGSTTTTFGLGMTW